MLSPGVTEPDAESKKKKKQIDQNRKEKRKRTCRVTLWLFVYICERLAAKKRQNTTATVDNTQGHGRDMADDSNTSKLGENNTSAIISGFIFSL